MAGRGEHHRLDRDAMIGEPGRPATEAHVASRIRPFVP